MRAYYNEHDPKAAAWLRELIKEGHITDGEVDERSIEDVLPADLAGFQRCHFFAGIGVWDYALNRAGWGDRQVWTGSCPCQPFSAAGKRGGTDDERHLWPAFFHLVSVCRPDALFGEQVASTDGLAWLDIVSSDLEGIGYTIGAADIPAAGFGAPHIRQRLFFVADSKSHGRRQRFESRRGNRGGIGPRQQVGLTNYSVASIVAESDGRGFSECEELNGEQARPEQQVSCGNDISGCGELRILADANGGNESTERLQRGGEHGQQSQDGRAFVGMGYASGSGLQGLGRYVGEYDQAGREATGRHSRAANFWANAEWIYCRDNKYRPIEPGTFPLANGIAGRVGLLRGYGNAINAEVAKGFIESYLEL